MPAWVRRRDAFRWAVALCAVLGMVLRLWNVDFDQRQHLNPDERFWAITSDALRRAPAPAAHGTVAGPLLDWLDGQRSPANAYRVNDTFIYGPLSLALARGTAGWLHDGVVQGSQPADATVHLLDAVGVPLLDGAGQPRFDAGYGVDLVGRMLGAVFDTITLVVVGLIARRLAGRLAGIIAAGLYALSVLQIQLAHFLGAEPLMGLACALVLLASLRLDRSANVRAAATSGALVGVASGLALAAKLTAVGLVAVPFIGCAALLVRHRRRSDVVRLAVLGLTTAMAFRVFNPAAFNGLGLTFSTKFMDDLRLARSLADSTQPPSFQWAGRIPVLQPLVWLGVFTVGPGTALAFVLGAVAMLRTRLRLHPDSGRWPVVVTGAAVVLPFGYIVVTSLPTGRYFVPMLPALYAVAGIGVTALIRWAMRHTDRRRTLALAAAGLSVGLAATWGIGFVAGVYGRENTRIEASHWMRDNIPRGSVVSSEAWDDGLPLQLPDIDTSAFANEQLNLVGPDDEAKVDQLADQLGRIDYVVESSARISDTVTRLPARFPSTIAFFRALDNGTIGFQRVATFSRGIQVGPFQLDDRRADEAFSVYDHAQVRIWKKTRVIDRAALIDILDPVAASNAIAVDPNEGSANGLMQSADEIATNASGPSYDQAFDVGGSGLAHAIGWFLLLELLGAAAFVLMLPLLHRLPDGGFGLSKLLALVITSATLFVAAAWLGLDLDRRLVCIVVLVLLGTAGVLGRRRRTMLSQLWRERRRILIAVEVLTTVMFVGFVLLRASDPDLWHPYRGGEKPFENALLTAVLRTKTLPVYDPWFSGGVLNYYYGGWFLLSVPARLFRTAPTIVMNIALGLFASCASGAAFTAGASIIDSSRRRWRSTRRRTRSAVAAGVMTVAFVLLLANNGVASQLWARAHTDTRQPFDWWALSRVIPRSVAVTEFPAWSFLFGDLHPHVMDIAVLVALGGLCVALHGQLIRGRRRDGVVLGGVVGIVIGLTRLTNTWDLPLALGLGALTVLLALLGGAQWKRCTWPIVAMAAGAFGLWAPYAWRGQVFDSGVDPATLRTPWGSWFVQFGFFAVVTVGVLVMAVVPVFRRSPVIWRQVTAAHATAAGIALIVLGYATLRHGRSVLITCAVLSLLSGSAAVWRWRDRSQRWSPLAPIVSAVGWAILAGVEQYTVKNDGGRTNTVFKFWYQSWILLAIGTAVAVVEATDSLALWRSRRHRRAVGWPALVGCLAVAWALAVSVAFWWRATPVRLDDRISANELSLDGTAFVAVMPPTGAPPDEFTPADDLPLIDWLRSNVHGVRVVTEATGGDYTWAGRISSLTGLPTPIAWGYHESQQRRAYTGIIDARQADMTSLYTTDDRGEIARILARYSVAYVVFGTLERLQSTPASVQALRNFECLSIVATGAVPNNDLFVGQVDNDCVRRLRPSGR